MDESMRESLLVRRLKKCIHFNGVQNRACKAGVRYASFDGGVPCYSGEAMAVCERACLPSREDVDAGLRETGEHIARMTKVMAAIMASRDAQPSTEGSIPCPCCSGTVRYSRARSNGHWAVRCSTQDCCHFIQ